MNDYAFTTCSEIGTGDLLAAYRAGFFPMGSPGTSLLHWFNPDIRSVIAFRDFRVPRRLARMIRRGGFQVTINREFDTVISRCADREETWISDPIKSAYRALHREGHAHSVEVLSDGALAGGLYGVAVGGAFFGESMFSDRPHASKIALVWLVDQLSKTGFSFLETQYATPHLESFGAASVSSQDYMAMLSEALALKADFRSQPPSASPPTVLQRISQTS